MGIKSMLTVAMKRIRRGPAGGDFVAPKTDQRGYMLTIRTVNVPADADDKR